MWRRYRALVFRTVVKGSSSLLCGYSYKQLWGRGGTIQALLFISVIYFTSAISCKCFYCDSWSLGVLFHLMIVSYTLGNSWDYSILLKAIFLWLSWFWEHFEVRFWKWKTPRFCFSSEKNVLLLLIYFQNLPCLHEAKESPNVYKTYYQSRNWSLLRRGVSQPESDR